MSKKTQKRNRIQIPKHPPWNPSKPVSRVFTIQLFEHTDGSLAFKAHEEQVRQNVKLNMFDMCSHIISDCSTQAIMEISKESTDSGTIEMQLAKKKQLIVESIKTENKLKQISDYLLSACPDSSLTDVRAKINNIIRKR